MSPASADDWRSRLGNGFGSYSSGDDTPRASRSRKSGSATSASRSASRAAADRAPAKRVASEDSAPARKTARVASRSSSSSVSDSYTGIASYYWQPQPVASGGRFNPDAMTAAHKTLPFWTRVRVTHLGNGRSVEVVINDRGPYIAGRIIDLSRAAAGVIGMRDQGIARVRVEVLGR
ncbi:MAG TPA: septal ring lytic transglycosylase RlpA family protein [Hyphomicrobiaceae bacterium]|nr:septal ring lytic transglycosylase RlpA family protein [Hyphomicrobiaceae bacterium]